MRKILVIQVMFLALCTAFTIYGDNVNEGESTKTIDIYKYTPSEITSLTVRDSMAIQIDDITMNFDSLNFSHATIDSILKSFLRYYETDSFRLFSMYDTDIFSVVEFFTDFEMPDLQSVFNDTYVVTLDNLNDYISAWEKLDVSSERIAKYLKLSQFKSYGHYRLHPWHYFLFDYGDDECPLFDYVECEFARLKDPMKYTADGDICQLDSSAVFDLPFINDERYKSLIIYSIEEILSRWNNEYVNGYLTGILYIPQSKLEEQKTHYQHLIDSLSLTMKNAYRLGGK